jgi:hypothetical protein
MTGLHRALAIGLLSLAFASSSSRGAFPAAASFSIASTGRDGAWHASTADGCRFGLEIAPAKGSFSRGAFVRERGISCGPFLSRVAAALETKEGAKAAQVDRVEFGAAILGADLRRETRGGFSGKGGDGPRPSRSWATATRRSI